VDFLIENPLLLIAILVLLIGALAAVKLFHKKEAKVDAGFIPGMDELLKDGKYSQAAVLAQRHGRYEQAIEYYLRAQDPLHAAQVAAKTKNARRAAELYERAGAFDTAADLYAELGMQDKAKEMRAAKGKSADEPTLGGNLQDELPLSSDDPERRFRQLEASLKDDVEGKAKLQEAGAAAAEELLRQGEIRKAAEIYKSAGLIDEAVHLYVNVLGAPGEAAPLVAERGNHERAAELYELAGKLERAASLWVDIARASSQPEAYIDRIEGLSEEVALSFLEDTTKARSIDDKSVELHYRLGLALQKKGEVARALGVYQHVIERMGGYKDVEDRMKTLRSPVDPHLEAQVSPAPEPRVKVVEPEEHHGIPQAPVHATAAANGPTLSSGPPRPEGTFPSAEKLTTAQVSAIAKEAVNAALEQASRGGLLPPLGGTPPSSARMREAARGYRAQIVVVGLEQKSVSLDELNDSATLAARDGPSIASLEEFIAGRSCDLQNIEVYYRLGLAHVANGQWAEALTAFDSVEEASPGYRDAEKRANKIRDWQNAVGTRMSVVTRGSFAKGGDAGRYRIHGELGRGGMAVVYRATDEVLGRDVALKFLAEELMSQKEMRDMFQREARSVAQLNHPNIVTIYDFGVLDGKAFICMEYIEGMSVEHYIDQRGKLPVVEALRITEQMLDALHYAHSRKIIHRDIKPSNVMRLKTGVVKLMDFGLAKSVAGGAQASIIAGTPAYMPPEQAQGGEVDHRADLFSVGCSLYEMLTGQLPFKGVDRSTPPPELRTHDDKLPEVLQDIVSRSLTFEPEGRYASAEEFIAPIRRVLDAVDRFTSSYVNTPKSPQPTTDKATAPQGSRGHSA